MNILIMGACRPGHDLLKSRGHHVTLFIKNTEASHQDLSFGYHNFFVFDKDSDKQKYIDVAKALHQQEAFDRIFCFSDSLQEVGALIALSLDMWFPISLETFHKVNDKYLCRQTLQKSGLNTVLYKLVHNSNEIKQLIKKIDAPVIVKPLASTGSFGICRIENVQSVDSAVERKKYEFPVLAEAFVDGRELSVEYFSHQGHHYLLGIVDKLKDPVNFVEYGHIVPANVNEEQKQAIESYVIEILNAVGVQFGPSHTEIIINHDGIHFIETHTRMGGDRIDELLKHNTNLNLYELIIDQVLSQKIDLRGRFDDTQPIVHAAAYFLLPQDGWIGKISEIKNLELAQNSVNISRLMVLKGVGSKLSALESSADRLALAIAYGQTKEEAISSAENALKCLYFEVSGS